ncbi:MAG: 16S rRNA (uracil(1498)-N(3))-methyltransferase, partial [Candidatus Taylorbacteria bacterium]|nr:16S rRNA (uracil(1498)-N(3))-methyltransferase [Candidatus Taylorbacteria bacterium]
HQWRDVFRYTVGGQVILFDDSKTECLSIIEELSHGKVNLVVLEIFKKTLKKETGKKTEKGIWLIQSMLKGDHFDFVVEKTTEIGVDNIVPVISERTIKQGVNIERARKIATEASEQSGRVSVPTIYDMVSLEKAIENFKSATNGMVLVLAQGGVSVTKLKEKIFKNKTKGKGINMKSIAVVVGPEGGWSPTEMQYFKKSGFALVSLGDTVLRGETAAIVGVFAVTHQN